MKPQHIATIVVAALICVTALIIHFTSTDPSSDFAATMATTEQEETGNSNQQRKERQLIEKQRSNPNDYIDIEVLAYKVRDFKTNRLDLRLKNRTKHIFYSNIVVELKLYSKDGSKTFTKRATFESILHPLGSDNFSMYENGITSVSSKNLKVIAASTFVAEDKALELGINQ